MQIVAFITSHVASHQTIYSCLFKFPDLLCEPHALHRLYYHLVILCAENQ